MTKMVPILQVLELVLLLLPLWNLNKWAGNGLDCQTYPAVNGYNCHMCQPGYFKIGDCDKNGMPAQCLMCHGGFFQETCNQATTCAKCSEYCYMFNSVIVSECNRTSDIVCECKEGFYLANKGVDQKCYKLKLCPPGYGMRKIGTKTEDTQCEVCVSGKNYSSVSSSVQPCQQCSECPVSLVLFPCTPFNDTVCAAVLNQHERDIGGIIAGSVVGFIILAAAVVGFLYFQNQHRRQRFHEYITNWWCNPAKQNQFGNDPQVAPPEIIADIPLPHVAEQGPNDMYMMRENINGHHAEQQVTEDLSDTEGDTAVDAGPISVSDVHLHNRHFEHLSERQNTPNHGNSSVSSNTELKQIEHGPRNFLQHEQPGAIGQCRLQVTPKNMGNTKQDKGPTEHATFVIPTDKTVVKIFHYLAKEIIKDFPRFFRELYESTASRFDGNMSNVNALIEQVDDDNKCNVVERNYQLLNKWSEKYGKPDEHFFIAISSALRQCDANMILSNLQEKFGLHFPTYGGNLVRGEI